MTSHPDPRAPLFRKPVFGRFASAAAALVFAACAPAGPGKPADKGAEKTQPVAQPQPEVKADAQPGPEDKPVAEPQPEVKAEPERPLPMPPT